MIFLLWNSSNPCGGMDVAWKQRHSWNCSSENIATGVVSNIVALLVFDFLHSWTRSQRLSLMYVVHNKTLQMLVYVKLSNQYSRELNWPSSTRFFITFARRSVAQLTRGKTCFVIASWGAMLRVLLLYIPRYARNSHGSSCNKMLRHVTWGYGNSDK